MKEMSAPRGVEPPRATVMHLCPGPRARYARARSFEIACTSTSVSLAFKLKIRTSVVTDVPVGTWVRIFRQKTVDAKLEMQEIWNADAPAGQ